MIIDCHNHVGLDAVFYARKHYPYAQDLESMVRQGRALGVDRWVTFPFVSYRGLTLDGQDLWPLQPGESPVPYAVENDRFLYELYRLFPEEARSVIPFVMLDPARQPREQVEALRRLREVYPQIRGFKIQATIIQSPIRALLDEGACLLDLAEEWDMPMLIHSSIAPTDTWSQAMDILDIVEQRPALRFNVAHSCRFHRPSLDRLASLPNAWFDCSAHIIHTRLALQNSPSVAVPSERFEADYRDPTGVLARLHEAYPKKLLWGSDSPYQSFVAESDGKLFYQVCTYAEEVGALKALPAAVVEQIAFTNSLAHLGLSPENL